MAKGFAYEEVNWDRMFNVYHLPADAARALGCPLSPMTRWLRKNNMLPEKWRSTPHMRGGQTRKEKFMEQQLKRMEQGIPLNARKKKKTTPQMRAVDYQRDQKVDSFYTVSTGINKEGIITYQRVTLTRPSGTRKVLSIIEVGGKATGTFHLVFHNWDDAKLAHYKPQGQLMTQLLRPESIRITERNMDK